MLNSSCLYDIHMERFRGRRIKGSGVWKTFMLKKEFGKEIDGVWVEQLYRLPKNKNVETIKKHIFRHSIEQNKFQMLLRTNHLKHTLVHLELRSCACSVISIMSNSVTLWTVAHQAPLSMGFSKQEYWMRCHALLQGIFPTQGSNTRLLCCRWILYHWATWEAWMYT